MNLSKNEIDKKFIYAIIYIYKLSVYTKVLLARGTLFLLIREEHDEREEGVQYNVSDFSICPSLPYGA